jgi:hypothetical protein
MAPLSLQCAWLSLIAACGMALSRSCGVARLSRCGIWHTPLSPQHTPHPPPPLTVLPGSRSQRSIWHGSLSLQHMAHPAARRSARPPPPTLSRRIARLSLSAQHMARLPLIAAHGRAPSRRNARHGSRSQHQASECRGAILDASVAACTAAPHRCAQKRVAVHVAGPSDRRCMVHLPDAYHSIKFGLAVHSHVLANCRADEGVGRLRQSE